MNTFMFRLGAFVALILPALASAADVILRSPSGATHIAVSVPSEGPIRWRVDWNAKPVLGAAPIGLDFAHGNAAQLSVKGVTRSNHDSQISGLIGKASSARDHYAEAVIDLSGDPHRALQLVLRAYDNGAAYRWRIRTDAGFEIADEIAGFGLSATAHVWASPAPTFTSSYEEYYRTGRLDQAVPDGGMVVLPMLFQTADGVWGAITEAALHDWAGLYLQRTAGVPSMGGRLSPRVDKPGIDVVGTPGQHLSPWRLVMLGDAPGRLIESNLVMLLNPPPDQRDWSWVKTGKTSFPWWNNYYWPGQGFTPGLNTATMKAYVDFDAAHCIPYHTLDGFLGQAWYGGPIGPDGTPQDLTTATPDIDMPELLRYARSKGVRIRVWTHWLPLQQQMDKALDTWASWGIAGVMTDFMNRDDQQMVAFYDELARKAADHHMTVVYHGAYKPTGEARTWPNVLSREAVRGTEYNKFMGNPGSTPEHETTLPFTRMLAGPMDTHQGGFDSVVPDKFYNRQTAPLVMGTRARALAGYVVQDNPMSMIADTPINYRHATGFDFVTAVPSTWDETRVLSGVVGNEIVIARRKGSDWWIGAISDASARDVPVALDMLGPGVWHVDEFVDDAAAPQGVRRVHRTIRSGDRMVIRMGQAGGYAAQLTPVH
ncbi:MAG: glycoside hydrolase family 97 protein [Pseudomonadota bacterium]|nr:glycoside hydrolase family 97 protein [Pseudomonadota bacterium]